MMDPEPGRCRRTDGKRWRCSRSVITGQKYCERHIHRGRQRPKQLVGNIPKFDVPIDNTRGSIPSLNSTNTSNSNNKTNISTRIDSRLASPASPNTRESAPTAVNVSSTSSISVMKASNSSSVNLVNTPTINISYNSKSEANDNFRVDSRCIASTSIKAGVANNSKSRHISNDIDGKDARLNHNKVREISRNNGGKEGCFSGFSVAVNGLSPKSVLQGSIDASCRSLGVDCKDVTGDIQRCRRTDGKKWQCSRVAIHGQKYCEKHMHRGVKRVAPLSNMAAVSAAAASTNSNSPFFVAKRVDNRIKPNADPCPLIAACTLITNGADDSSTSSSSSDATTITD